jgi:hypothetical protein
VDSQNLAGQGAIAPWDFTMVMPASFCYKACGANAYDYIHLLFITKAGSV